MYQIAIVEDEAEAKDALQAHLDRYASEHGETFVISWFTSAMEFENSRRTFDLIFMDIQLPGITGMESAQLIRTYDEATPIIFVTNLAQYAVRGYEVNALDFIVKPVHYFDFRMRMDKALRHIRRNAEHKLVVPTRDGMHILPLADIEYVDVNRHNVSYHLINSENPVVAYGSLRAVEKEVEGGPFVRVSSSCLANMNHIRSVHGSALNMASGTTLYFSRSCRRPAMDTIVNFLGGSI